MIVFLKHNQLKFFWLYYDKITTVLTSANQNIWVKRIPKVVAFAFTLA